MISPQILTEQITRNASQTQYIDYQKSFPFIMRRSTETFSKYNYFLDKTGRSNKCIAFSDVIRIASSIETNQERATASATWRI